MSDVPVKISTCLWFDTKAEEAANFYTALIPGSEITAVMRNGQNGEAIMVTFTLGGVPFQALNGGPKFKPSEAASIVVTTRDQAETDRIWNALVDDGGAESMCAWCKDRFGVSWQVVPDALGEYLSAPDRAAANRAMAAMMKMKKIVIADLAAAFKG